MHQTASPFNWKYNPKFNFYDKPKLVLDWNKEGKGKVPMLSTQIPETYDIQEQNSKIKNFIVFSKQLKRPPIYKQDPNYIEYEKPIKKHSKNALYNDNADPHSASLQNACKLKKTTTQHSME